MRFEARCFSPKTWRKKNEKQRKAEELDRNNNSKSPQTGKVWINFSHLSCKMVVVNWSTGDADWFHLFGKKIILEFCLRYIWWIPLYIILLKYRFAFTLKSPLKKFKVANSPLYISGEKNKSSLKLEGPETVNCEPQHQEPKKWCMMIKWTMIVPIHQGAFLNVIFMYGEGFRFAKSE